MQMIYLLIKSTTESHISVCYIDFQSIAYDIKWITGFQSGSHWPDTIKKSRAWIGVQLTIVCSINRKLRSGD